MSANSKISQELHKKIFELTLALYRVTDFFPQSEIMRKQLREKANEIFGSITEYDYCGGDPLLILGKIQTMRGYLKISGVVRFVKPVNVNVLGREYDLLARFFEKEFELSNGSDSRETVSHEGKIKIDFPVEVNIDNKDSKDNFVPYTINVRDNMSDMSDKQSKEQLSDKGQEEHRDDYPNNPINERQKVILTHLKTRPRAKISDFYSLFTDLSSKTIQRDLQDLVSKNILAKEGEKRWTVYSLKV